jgi:hypothetical protein
MVYVLGVTHEESEQNLIEAELELRLTTTLIVTLDIFP